MDTSRNLLRRCAKVVALAVVIVVVQVGVAFAASAFFSSSSATPAVKGVNSSGASNAMGVFGVASNTGTSRRYGVYGKTNGSGGVGVRGDGAHFGVFSGGDLGIAAGKKLKCSGCVTASDLAIEVVHHAGSFTSVTEANNGVSCPAGKRPIAGGGTTDSFNMMPTDIGIGASSVSVRWESDNNALLTGNSDAWATCIPN
jgi:hypothetical protein